MNSTPEPTTTNLPSTHVATNASASIWDIAKAAFMGMASHFIAEAMFSPERARSSLSGQMIGALLSVPDALRLARPRARRPSWRTRPRVRWTSQNWTATGQDGKTETVPVYVAWTHPRLDRDRRPPILGVILKCDDGYIAKLAKTPSEVSGKAINFTDEERRDPRMIRFGHLHEAKRAVERASAALDRFNAPVKVRASFTIDPPTVADALTHEVVNAGTDPLLVSVTREVHHDVVQEACDPVPLGVHALGKTVLDVTVPRACRPLLLRVHMREGAPRWTHVQRNDDDPLEVPGGVRGGDDRLAFWLGRRGKSEGERKSPKVIVLDFGDKILAAGDRVRLHVEGDGKLDLELVAAGGVGEPPPDVRLRKHPHGAELRT